jgi:MFS family permease
MAPGGTQLILVAAGTFFAAGTAGPAGAMVANLTPASIRATAFGTLTLANNLLGLAAGPFVAGILADRLGLADAMQVVPFVSVLVIVALLVGLRAYPASLRRTRAAAAA